MLSRKHFKSSRALLAVAFFLLEPALERHLLPLPSTRAVFAGESADNERGSDGLPLLTPGKPLTRELSAGEVHAYRVALDAGQYFQALAEQHGMDASVTLAAPDGRVLVRLDCRRREPTPVSIITDSSGDYRLEVRSLEERGTGGRYELRIAEIRSATATDEYRIAAERYFAEGERLLKDETEESSRSAINKYEAAASSWRAAGVRQEQGHALKRVGDIYFSLSEYPAAVSYYKRALSVSRETGDLRGEGEAANGIAYVYLTLGQNQKALSFCARALKLSRATNRRQTEAQAVNNLGEIRYGSGDLTGSVDYFQKSLSLWRELGDRRGQALALLNEGYTYSDLGQAREAFDSYKQALALWQAAHDRRGEGVTLAATGRLYSRVGESQEALDFFERATPLIRPTGNPVEEGKVLTGMAYVYGRVGQEQRAIDFYEHALSLYRSAKLPDAEAATLYSAGKVYFSLGDSRKALEYHSRALSIFRAVGDRRVEIIELKEIGRIYDSWGDETGALKNYLLALSSERAQKDLREETDTLSLMGRVYEEQGASRLARACYQRALELSREAEYPFGEAATRYNLARVERAGGDLDGARAQAEAALSLVESLRSKVASQDLRASYFASVRQLYELYINLLMEQHRRQPAAGYDAAAFEASERARARSLLETLAAARVGVRERVAPELLARERELRGQLNEKVERRMGLPAGGPNGAEAQALVGEIDELTAQYHEVEAQVRAAGAEFTEQSQPQPLSLGEIRARDLDDDDTLLLEFSLGEERSYLWVVSKDSLRSYELPPRAEVEEAANRVRELLTAPAPVEGESFDARQARLEGAEEAYWREASALSEMILAPAASSLGAKRLLVVADGALQFIPFGALSVPGRQEPTPLLVEHEITSQPSASALAALRGEESSRRRETTKAVAVFADPVFEADDSRIGLAREATNDGPRAQPVEEQAQNSETPVRNGGAELAQSHVTESQGQEAELHQALRDVSAAWDGSRIPRLQASSAEAKAITGATEGAENLVAVGFDADKTTATSPELGRYRIIHFATHGVLDSEHPELSGLLLSRFDRRGRAREGFLRLDDIYNLNLPAELVVLSACNTGLGKDVRGEGLVGLVRGFMYAGSARVVASLWKVDDDATEELMARFYREMLSGKRSPAGALREAQVAMWRGRRWHAPYYWAAFVLQGEYGGRIEVRRGARTSAPRTLAVAAALVVLLSCLYTWRRRARTKRR
jgi:CHAT domain-containing protein/tetratricopeptide (TPR) repeat protein